MEYLFHEIQEGSLCAQHCLNSLLQGDFFTAVDLAQIAEDLDRQERLHMSEAKGKDYERFLNQESSNYDDSGFFSIQVIQKALLTFSLDLIPYSSQNQQAVLARQDPTTFKAFICNFKEHWYTIRKIGNYWFNFNSMFKKPELISETYLQVLLAQLVNDGYSIFIVDGDLPKNLKAEASFLQRPLDTKGILSSSSKKAKSNQFEDEDLKKAIRMSLLENDMDLDQLAGTSGVQYPSLAVDLQQSQDDDLKRAIEMSLAADSVQPVKMKAAEELTAEQMRDKRLKRFESLNKTKEPSETIEEKDQSKSGSEGVQEAVDTRKEPDV